MNLNDWFDKGIEKEEYMAALDQHRDSFMKIYNNFKVPEQDKSLLKSKSHLRVVVLAEVWCGHCMLDVPILLRIAETANIAVRILPRDEHLELMDNYLTNEKRYIPIIIFIDEDGNEVTKWGPMAPEIATFVEELKTGMPEKDAPGYKEAFKKYVDAIGDTFRNDEKFWNYVYEDIKKTLP
ncbi:thioredoxin family protein [Pseudogracilibacillus sp. SO30301A]|uniref:thioredoxin family protein n=1 Tax=Pseudogracilibacillus sp. SO30301A TaxID=3098291 RepID=UPI00300DFA0B